MSRNAAATELQGVMETINGLAKRGERLAEASGQIVDPLWFRAAQNAMTMAAGDLDSKNLLVARHEEETAP